MAQNKLENMRKLKRKRLKEESVIQKENSPVEDIAKAATGFSDEPEANVDSVLEAGPKPDDKTEKTSKNKEKDNVPTSTDSNPLDYRYRVIHSAYPEKSRTLSIAEKLMEYIDIRCAQIGMTRKDYLSLLFEEEKRRVDLKNIDPFSIKRPQKSKNKNISIMIPEDVDEFLAVSAARHGFRVSQYVNYILLNEKDREQKEGYRQRVEVE